MHQMRQSYRGLSLFMGLNMDRLVTVTTIAMALLAASWLQSL